MKLVQPLARWGNAGEGSAYDYPCLPAFRPIGGTGEWRIYASLYKDGQLASPNNLQLVGRANFDPFMTNPVSNPQAVTLFQKGYTASTVPTVFYDHVATTSPFFSTGLEQLVSLYSHYDSSAFAGAHSWFRADLIITTGQNGPLPSSSKSAPLWTGLFGTAYPAGTAVKNVTVFGELGAAQAIGTLNVGCSASDYGALLSQVQSLFPSAISLGSLTTDVTGVGLSILDAYEPLPDVTSVTSTDYRDMACYSLYWMPLSGIGGTTAADARLIFQGEPPPTYLAAAPIGAAVMLPGGWWQHTNGAPGMLDPTRPATLAMSSCGQLPISSGICQIPPGRGALVLMGWNNFAYGGGHSPPTKSLVSLGLTAATGLMSGGVSTNTTSVASSP